MQISFERLASTVFSHYTFRVLDQLQSQSLDQHRGQDVIFDSDHGNKQLRIYDDPKQLQHDYELSEYLATHGYRRIPRMIRTKHGDAYVSTEDKWFVMTDLIEGDSLAFSPESILPFTRNLAFVHLAIRGFPLQHITRTSTVTWKELMLEAVDVFQQTCEEWNRELNRMVRDAFQSHTLQHLDWYSSHAKWVERSFHENIKDALDRCLGDIRLEGYRIGSNRKVYMTSYPKPYADTPVYDLAKLCLIALEQGHPDAIPDILDEYSRVREIRPSELEQLRTYLAFPHTNWKLLFLYRRRRGNVSQIAELAEQELEKNQRREVWVKEVFPVSK